MASELNRKCPYCGHKLKWESYMKPTQSIAYCDNDDCPVKPCTDATTPKNVYAEILAITGDKE
ncbi:hypothetical protein D9O40_00830 [Clostridium autoethanogenum]|uniref:Uncharacterized protein n=1 Tax=Clostridium autoethanogenum TaxID=84023 RepID=A0A3M0T3W1_9CLOT|nr:hypothetical protein [Clostridium autoethanogenum]RMD04925.1 hypothetical protein D9O40_00830 [Clostridium autoethanogenum]